MRIEAFLLCWNEIDIMPLVIKHYQKFCNKITILDNYSNDGSDKLAESMGCEVVKFGTKFFDDGENMKVKNNCWKGSEADFVIVADFDEILCRYEPSACGLNVNIPLLDSQFTIYKTIGWQVMSERMPKYSLLECTQGYEFKNYAKNIIFNPQAIKEINYGLGSHDCSPTGLVNWSTSPLYVLHYKHIGGVHRTIDRYKQYKPRMSKFNRKHGHGSHYNRSVSSLKQEWAERMAKSRPLI